MGNENTITATVRPRARPRPNSPTIISTIVLVKSFDSLQIFNIFAAARRLARRVRRLGKRLGEPAKLPLGQAASESQPGQ